MKYKFLNKEVTSDIMFEAYGRNFKELLINSAEALMFIICDIKKVKAKKIKHITIECGSFDIKKDYIKELMFSWLQELIASVDTEEMFFSKFIIDEIRNNYIKARIYGEPISREKGRTLVKAVTYHKFDVSKDKKGYKARIVLDI